MRLRRNGDIGATDLCLPIALTPTLSMGAPVSEGNTVPENHSEKSTLLLKNYHLHETAPFKNEILVYDLSILLCSLNKGILIDF